jgi:pyruvate/2-oxoglutarate/acetoin dehydrogenase E1 component
MTVLENLNASLHQIMKTDERVVIIGEDLLDPYGGAFKVTRGLSSAYPERVLSSPISEASIVGLAAGMALRGLRPVVEIMFGDFLTLAADQLVNHIAKFRWMYNDQVRVPLVIRTPMGGRRGYGPTHSQTLEKHFLGVPGLKVVAPCALQVTNDQGSAEQSMIDPGQLLSTAVADDDPVLFIENKLLYLCKLQTVETLPDFKIRIHDVSTDHSTVDYATFLLRIKGAPSAKLTLVAYGHMAELALEAVLDLAYKHEIFTDLVIPTQLTPYQPSMTAIVASVTQTGCLLVVEEGTLSLGWGAEILARTTEVLGDRLIRARRVAARDVPIPAAGVLEEAVLPNMKQIIAAAQKMV